MSDAVDNLMQPWIAMGIDCVRVNDIGELSAALDLRMRDPEEFELARYIDAVIQTHQTKWQARVAQWEQTLQQHDRFCPDATRASVTQQLQHKGDHVLWRDTDGAVYASHRSDRVHHQRLYWDLDGRVGTPGGRFYPSWSAWLSAHGHHDEMKHSTPSTHDRSHSTSKRSIFKAPQPVASGFEAIVQRYRDGQLRHRVRVAFEPVSNRALWSNRPLWSETLEQALQQVEAALQDVAHHRADLTALCHSLQQAHQQWQHDPRYAQSGEIFQQIQHELGHSPEPGQVPAKSP